MADYRVKVNKEGRILAGTMKKEDVWNHNSDVTEEALAAARDHLLIMSKNEGKDIAYAWQYDNGNTVILKLEVKKIDEIKQEEDVSDNAEENTEEKEE